MSQVHKFGSNPQAQILMNTLGPMVQQCGLNKNWAYWLFSNSRVASISFVCQMWVDCLIPNSIETHDFDVEFQILWQRMQKKVVQVLKPFLSFMLSFPSRKVNNILVLMLHPHYKELGLFMQYIGKEKILHIISDYNRQVLFPQLLCTYKFLNLANVSEKTLSFALKFFQSSSLYDAMEIDEDVALSMVKNQLFCFKIKKVIEEEWEGPLTWLRAHEVHYSYVGFVAQQILEIVGSQIEVEFISILQLFAWTCPISWFGMDNLEMLINIYKNWSNDVHVGDAPPIRNSWKWKKPQWMKMMMKAN